MGRGRGQTKAARLQRERAEHNLALATETANGLIFDVAQKFQDFGLPAATVQNILSALSSFRTSLLSAVSRPQTCAAAGKGAH